MKGMIKFVTVGMMLTTLLLWIVIPDEVTLNISTSIFTLVLVIFCVGMDYQKYKIIFESSRFKEFSSATISAFLLFCILGMLNYLNYKHPKQWDFSLGSQMTLTDQSVQIIKDFDEKVTFRIFTRKQNLGSFFLKLDQYRLENNLVEKEFIDVDLHPELVKKYNVTKDDAILISYKGRNVFVDDLSELGITNALIRVKKERKPKIYYTIGHQELEFNSEDGRGASHLKRMLNNSNFELVPIELTLTKEIPRDANLLMVVGPQSDFMKREIQLIDGYLENDGSLFIAIDPNPNGDKLPALRALLKKRNFEIKNNFVIDRIKFVQGSQTKIPMVNKWKSRHDIVKGFKKSVFFPLVSSVVYTGDRKTEGEFSSLAQTSLFPASWAENNIKQFIDGNILFEEASDIKGPVTLFGAWKSSQGKSRIILSGNSSFITNAYEKFGGNHHLAINSISWLVNEDKLISFNTPIIKNDPIFIAPQQVSLIFFATVVFIPILLLSMSIFLYRRRLKL